MVRSIWVTKMSLNWVSLVSISVVCDCAQCVNAWIFVLLLSFVSTTRIYFHNTIYPHLLWVYGLFNWPQNQKKYRVFFIVHIVDGYFERKKKIPLFLNEIFLKKTSVNTKTCILLMKLSKRCSQHIFITNSNKTHLNVNSTNLYNVSNEEYLNSEFNSQNTYKKTVWRPIVLQLACLLWLNQNLICICIYSHII